MDLQALDSRETHELQRTNAPHEAQDACEAKESHAPHEAYEHHDGSVHHHHSHADDSHHAGGHHLLQVESLSVTFSMYDNAAPFFRAKKQEQRVISDLSLSVHAGEVIAVVGASGSGKSLLADSIMGLYEPNAIVSGTVWFDGVRQDAASLAQLRGHEIAFVPQSVASLDPLMTVGKQVRGIAGQVERSATEDSNRACAERQRALFEHYNLRPEVEDMYPFELSGGMARRVLLACALMGQPRLIVADEPTPGLNLGLAVRALDDLRAFANEGGGVLLITHDIELALRVADRVAIFREGTIVEETSVASFKDPTFLRHEFSRQLWHALPENGFVADVQGAI